MSPPLPACPFCGGQPALTKLTCQGQGCGAWRRGVTQALQVALALKVDIAAAGQRLVAREST